MTFFPERSGIGGIRLPTNSISPNDPIMKAWEHRMVAYFMEITYPQYPFF